MAFDAIVTSTTPVLEPVKEVIEVPSDVIEWPWPRLFATRSKVLLITKQSSGHLCVFEMNMDYSGSWMGYIVGDLGPDIGYNFIDVADFGPFYVLCITTGSTIRTFVRDPRLDIATIDRDIVGVNLINEITAPVMATCTNYKQQFIGGNILNHFEQSSNGIAWSAIGSFEFNPEIDKTAGFKNLISNQSSGAHCTIKRVMAMQEGVIIYTDHGNVVLVDDLVSSTFTYGIVPLHGLGIASGNHVAGDTFTHGFIDLDYQFWILENISFRSLNQTGGKITRRGYQDFIKPLFENGNEVIVSYTPLNRTFYISNGMYSLVINDFGAFTMHQAVSSVVMGWDNKLHGTFRDYGDTEARITLDTTDFGDRNMKTLEALLIGYSCAAQTAVAVSSRWKMRNEKEMVDFTWRPANYAGEARLCLSASEYAPQVRFSNYVGTSIYSITANVKFPDARFRRGVSIRSGGGN